MALKFQTRFNHTRQEGIVFTEPSLTQQSFGFETDINNIVKGMVQPGVNSKPASFGLTVSPDSYEQALNLIADAKSKFEELPSHIRAEFDNQPGKLIEFLNDDKNRSRAEELGLVEKKASSIVSEIKEPSTVIAATPEAAISEPATH